MTAREKNLRKFILDRLNKLLTDVNTNPLLAVEWEND